MAHILRSAEAAIDLRGIAGYIAQDNPPAAMNWLEEMEKLFSTLAAQPQMGERLRTRRQGFVRRVSRGNYVVYYRPVSDGIEILRVLHGARNHDQIV